MRYYGYEIKEATGQAATVWEYELSWDGVVVDWATNMDELKLKVAEHRIRLLEDELKEYETSALIREYTELHNMGFNQIGEG